ncbi:MAG: protein kinase [Deltaproteobacteria bacterium]|nr:protein kinase [Deltaproteobacteria bacterium]
MKVCPKCKGACNDADRVCPSCGTEIGAVGLADSDALIGMRLIDKYELTEYLGEGAMGWVYRGRHMTLGSSVAVKILKPSLTKDDQRAERFKREARAASRLNHPHIISVIDFGETDSGLLFIVSELLRGETLSATMQKVGPMPIKRTIRLISQILSALEESHSAGVVHRDLKPDNIMISRLRGGEDFIKVLDFGIAKVADSGQSQLTQAGQLFGTPDYMAPEQIRSQDVTGRADIYSTGVILFELLTGRLPFQTDNLFDVLKDHLYTAPPTLAKAYPEGNFSEDMEAVVAKALAKQPEDRFSSAREFHRALRRAARLATGKVQTCPACQQLIRKGARFCPRCGYRLEAPTTGNGQTEASSTPTGAKNTREAKGTQRTVDRLWAGDSIHLPFAGRTSELSRVAEVTSGQVAAMLIVGEPGVGKSSLLSRAVANARQAGLGVVVTHPHRTMLPVSWFATKTAIQQALGLRGLTPDEPELRQAIAEHGDLDRETAGLLQLFGLPGPLAGASSHARHAEMVAASKRTLLLASQAGKLLAFDDIELYDGTSTRLVLDVLRNAASFGAHVIATSTVPLLDDSDTVPRLELHPLEKSTVSYLVSSLAQNSGDSWTRALEEIAANSKGNPLWIEQALALLNESGTEENQGLSDLIATRISRLPTEALLLVQGLACFGRHATRDTLTRLLDGKAPMQATIDLLVHQDLVAVVDAETLEPASNTTNRTAIMFRHDLIFQVVRESLPAEVRQRLNKNGYELRKETACPVVVLAHHLLDAKDYKLAVETLEVAGDAAVAVFDQEAAVALYRKALDVARWKLLLAEDDDVHIRLNLKLAEVLVDQSDVNSAQVLLRYLEDIAAGRPTLACQVRLLLGKVYPLMGKPTRGINALRQAVGQAILTGDGDLLTATYYALSRLLISVGDLQGARQELEEGLTLITAGQGPRIQQGPSDLWRILARLANLVADDPAEKERAWELASAALRLAEQSGCTVGAARCHILLAQIDESATDQGRAHFATAFDTLQHLGDRQGQAEVLLHQAKINGNGSAGPLRDQAYELAREIGWMEGIKLARRSSPSLDITF